MKKEQIKLSFRRAATILGVSKSTILRLVQRGTIHATEPALRNHHWTRSIIADRAFQDEETRRKNGLKSQRRKRITTGEAPSSTQTITDDKKNELTQAAMLERAENAMNICLEAQKACSSDKKSAENAMGICINARKDCQEIKDSITRYQHEVDTWAMEKVRAIKKSELTCTRCTAILAAACILQALLAVYYTLCHFNTI